MVFPGWQEFDHERKSWYYYDSENHRNVYADETEAHSLSSNAGQGRNAQAAQANNVPWTSSYGRGASIRTVVPNQASGRMPHIGSTVGYSSPQNVNLTQGAPYRYGGYTQPSYEHQYQNQAQIETSNAYMPYQNSISHESQGHSRPVEQGNDVRPSDQELLRQVARDVVFRPTVQSTPPEFRPLGVPPHRVFRGSPRHGRAERLDPSFQVRFPGYQYYRTGVVFRVLWPELAGDVKQNITIATTQYGENIFYKIRWFVVVREGHNCCTCLSIQTYGGRGVPPGKPKEHHAIMYTGDTEPEASPSEMVHGEPPMGRSIRVISKQPWMKLDKMSRVNFVKIYTVEHNVKVEDFGRVDPEDEWKLMTQFNLHWGIPGREALPPATRSSYYDGTTYGPAPSTIAPQNQVYSAATQGPTPYTSNIPAMNGDTTSSRDAQHQYQVPPTEQYISSTHTSSSYVPVIDDTHYDTDDRPTYHHRSDSHKSNQSHGSHGQRRRY